MSPNLVSVFVFSPVTNVREIQVIVSASMIIRVCFSPSFIHPLSKSWGPSARHHGAPGGWPQPQGTMVSAPCLGKTHLPPISSHTKKETTHVISALNEEQRVTHWSQSVGEVTARGGSLCPVSSFYRCEDGGLSIVGLREGRDRDEVEKDLLFPKPKISPLVTALLNWFVFTSTE